MTPGLMALSITTTMHYESQDNETQYNDPQYKQHRAYLAKMPLNSTFFYFLTPDYDTTGLGAKM
jgi:hypothetical protein